MSSNDDQGPPDPAGVFKGLLRPYSTDNDILDYDMVHPINRSTVHRSAKYHVLNTIHGVVLSACIGSFLFGFSISNLNVLLSLIVWELKVCGDAATDLCKNADKHWKAWIYSTLFFGAAIGAFICIPLLERGRRTSIIISNILFILGAVTMTVSNTLPSFVWARLLTGLALGIASVAVPTYLSEMTPPNLRGFYGLFHQAGVVTGILFGVLIGLPAALVSPLPADPNAEATVPLFAKVWWRVTVCCAIIPAFICWFLFERHHKDETPHWYLSKGDLDRAKLVVQRIYGGKEDVRNELAVILSEVRLAARGGGGTSKPAFSFRQAWKNHQLRKVLFLGGILAVFQQISGINVYISSSNDIFREAGQSYRVAVASTAGLMLLNLIATFPAAYLVRRFSRRKLLTTGCILQTLALVPAAVVFSMESVRERYGSWLVPASVAGFILFFAIGYGPILWMYVVELYPMEVRGGSSGIAVTANWLTAGGVLLLYKYLHPKLNFIILLGLSFLSILVVRLVAAKDEAGAAISQAPSAS